LGLALLAPVSLVATPARASVARQLELPELTHDADLVATGRVLEQRSRWDDRGRIVTDVRIHIDERVKGDAGREVTLRCLGGAIGRLGMRVPGEPRFDDGERVVLFAVHRGAALRALGMSQGVMRIEERDGQTLVHPGGEGLSLVAPGPSGQLTRAAAALPGPQPLDELLATLRQLVAAEQP
jgi:hypothetical protein